MRRGRAFSGALALALWAMPARSGQAQQPPGAASASSPTAATARVCAPCADPRLFAAGSALEALAQGLERDKLSSEPIGALVREALAKRIAPARLLAAARQLDRDLRIGVRLLEGCHLGPAVPRTFPLVIVEALRAGVQPAQLRTLLGTVGRYGATRAERSVETLTDLAVRGYPVPATLPLVQTAARSRHDLEALAPAIDRLRARLGAPATALAEIGRVLAAGEDLERVAGGPAAVSGPGRGQGGLDDGRGRDPNRDSSQGRQGGRSDDNSGKGRGKGRGSR